MVLGGVSVTCNGKAQCEEGNMEQSGLQPFSLKENSTLCLEDRQSLLKSRFRLWQEVGHEVPKNTDPIGVRVNPKLLTEKKSLEINHRWCFFLFLFFSN